MNVMTLKAWNVWPVRDDEFLLDVAPLSSEHDK